MRKFKKICAAFFVGLLATGCAGDYLDNEPSNSISRDKAVENTEGLRYILEGVHNMIYSYNFSNQVFTLGQPGLNVSLDLLGDDMINTKPAYHMSVYRWEDHTSPDGEINLYAWDYFYTIIQHLNEIIGAVDNVKNAAATEVATLKGEAYSLRAWAYFNLVQLYGKRYVKGEANDNLGVIIRKEVSYDARPRSTVAEVYKLIDEDIKTGLENLEKAPDLERKNVIRYSTACGIAARIALAKSEWADAEKYADLAIKHSGATLQQGGALCDGFCDLSASEWMWGYYQGSDQDFFYASYFCAYSYNFNGHNKGFKHAVNRTLYDKMGKNDARRGWWVCLDQGDKIPKDASASYFEGGMSKPNWEVTGQQIKYRAKGAEDTHGDLLIMRLGEMYYIKAEAQARQGSGREADARATLLEIMSTRDPEYKTEAVGDELMDEIFRNKRIDLWMEGQRFFDMKRLGIIPDRLNSANIQIHLKGNAQKTAITRNSGTNAKKIAKSVDDKYWEFAIPYTEIRGNDQCVQNPL